MTQLDNLYVRGLIAAQLVPTAIQLSARPASHLNPRVQAVEVDMNRVLSMAVDLADGILGAIAQKDTQRAKAAIDAEIVMHPLGPEASKGS